ncbi:hypothetical protein BGW38_001872 [Lunasporangiospora selenospora]|uniref:Uncharacterized protein n=1 Tax=Lunasporangiospora selenospora TaxID=979761 RepID=A0A9P6KDS7_9FUNG|nr:hypothetical protein BGW38_001872 [Lunasporangiospora selenospora]
MSTAGHSVSSVDLRRARDEFILQNAPRKNIKQLAQEFFEAFNLSMKSAALDSLHASLKATKNNELARLLKEDDFKEWATRYFTLTKSQKKLSIQNIVDKERNKLQITGVLKGSKFIKSGMDLLAPEGDHIAASTSAAANPERNPTLLSTDDSRSAGTTKRHLDETIVASLETSRKRAHRKTKEGGVQRPNSRRAHEHGLQETRQPWDHERVQAHELKQRCFGEDEENTTVGTGSIIRLTEHTDVSNPITTSSSSSSTGTTVLSPVCENKVELVAAANKVHFDISTVEHVRASIGDVEVGPRFYELQREAITIVNDTRKRLDMSNLHLFLAANYVWLLDHQLPSMPHNEHESVKMHLKVDHAELPDTVTTLCTQLGREMAHTGRIRIQDRTFKDDEEENAFALFLSISKKLAKKNHAFTIRIEDTFTHGAFDPMMTYFFSEDDMTYILDWANLPSTASRARRGDPLKPDLTLQKHTFETAYVEIRSPKDERNVRFFLEDQWKLIGFAKDTIDENLRNERAVTEIPCLQVFGYQLTLYRMTFHKGLYVWQTIDTAYLPRDTHDCGSMVACLELLQTFKQILDSLNYLPYVHTPPNKAQDWMLPVELRPRATNISPTTRPLFPTTKIEYA